MSGPQALTPELLRAMPLPQPEPGGDKDGRGRVLVVGGSRQVPGAAVLAATSALRAGAGKLQLAVGDSLALPMGFALPESLVLGLAETEEGGIDPSSAGRVVSYVERADGFLIGPGMMGAETVTAFTRALLATPPRRGLVLDAEALKAVEPCRDLLARHEGRVVLTPHAGEMAGLLKIEKEEVEADPLDVARRGSAAFGAVVILKGRTSHIVAPDGAAFINQSGHVGLATSGSGDTMAGLICGLLARGASPLQAALFGVHVHAAAGAALGDRYGGIGYLARELPAMFPPILARLAEG